MSAPLQKRRVGLAVIANGYPGTITRVCEWSNSLVEVRLAAGTVCVDYNGIDCYPAPIDRSAYRMGTYYSGGR